MSEKPEALRLADDLDAGWCSLRLVLEPAAAELRRQHAEIEQLREQNTILDATCTKLDMVRDELLEHLEAEKSVCREGVRRTVADTTDLLTAALASLNNGNPGPAVAIERIESALDELRALRAAVAKATGVAK